MHIDEFIARLEKVTDRGGGQYTALCPAHDDGEPSLSIKLTGDGKIILKCFGGCEVESIAVALGLRMSDLFEKPQPAKRGGTTISRGLQLAELAKSKHLPEEFLRSLGIEDGWDEKENKDGTVRKWRAVIIRYHNLDGSVATRFRLRSQFDSGRALYWNRGCKDATLPYGLSRLHEAAKEKYLVIVEGESDSWTLWHHGIPALGLPGASTFKKIKAGYLQGVEKVYILQEPGDAGASFVASGYEHLSSFKRWKGEVFAITLPHKDASDLHINDKENFKAVFEKSLAEAVSASTVEKPKKKSDKEYTGTLTPTTIRPFTDLGNAERLLDHFGQELLYCHDYGKWIIWDGKRWNMNQPSGIYKRAHRTVRAIVAERKLATEDKLKKAISTHAKQSESVSRINAIIKLAEGKQTIRQGSLDQRPQQLNVLNGTVDLTTGKLEPHNPQALITSLAPVEYDPDATCPKWDAFLHRILGENDDLISFVQRAVGYSLTGHTSEECLFILYGTGRNGKSKFIETLRLLFGDYACSTPAATFLDRGNFAASATNDVARLRGVRFVSASETEDGNRLNEGQVKQLTGGDTLTARFLYQEHFDFKPVCKIWLACNHKPRVRGTDEGIWSRLKIIPFNVFIPPEERDHDLLTKLSAELPGILNWALAGCRKWRESKLGNAEKILISTSIYRKEMDLLGQFIAEVPAVFGSAFAVSD